VSGMLKEKLDQDPTYQPPKEFSVSPQELLSRGKQARKEGKIVAAGADFTRVLTHTDATPAEKQESSQLAVAMMNLQVRSIDRSMASPLLSSPLLSSPLLSSLCAHAMSYAYPRTPSPIHAGRSALCGVRAVADATCCCGCPVQAKLAPFQVLPHDVSHTQHVHVHAHCAALHCTSALQARAVPPPLTPTADVGGGGQRRVVCSAQDA
jgi:hypothetical protein